MNARQKMSLLHDTIMEISKPIADAVFAGFKVDRVEKDLWNCFLIVLYYVCNIPEMKDMSYVKHGIALTRPCVRFLITMYDFPDL